MRKKSLLLISPVLVAGAISSCGSGWNKVSTEDAIKVANAYDTRLSDVVMKDSDASIHINKFGVKNGTGLFSYQKLDESGAGKIVGVDLNNLSFTMGEQDVAQALFPNMLLNDANNVIKKTTGKKKTDTTFANIGYILSATISSEMIKYYTGSLKELYGVTEWQHMKTNLYSKKSSNGNDILQADITIDSFTGLKDEMVAAKIPEVESVFKILGEGSMKVAVTCDDFGYISHLGIVAKSDANKKLTYKTGTQASSGGGSLPGISDIIGKKIMPVGIDFEGEVDVDFSIDLTHNQAEEYGVSFQKSLYTIKDATATHVSTDTIADVTKDAALDINPYAPIKVDPVRRDKEKYPEYDGMPIFGPTATAFEGNGYAVKINLKKGEKESDWVLGKDYMYMGYDATETELEKQCLSMLYWYNVDKVGNIPEGWEKYTAKKTESGQGLDDWSDDAQAYPYATLIINGIRVPTKTPESGSIFGSDYCYFTVEMPTNEAAGYTPKATDLYLVLHVGKDVISKAKKTLGQTPKLTVDLKLQKLK